MLNTSKVFIQKMGKFYMKRFIYLLTIVLLFSSLSDVHANWNGFYLRGALASRVKGQTDMANEKLLELNHASVAVLLDFAAGWGTVINDTVYLGVDAQFGNFKVGLDNPRHPRGKNFSENRNLWTLAYRPVLQAKIGLPQENFMPYIAAGIGYVATTTYNNITGGLSGTASPDLLPNSVTYSVRLGIDVKIDTHWIFGGYLQYEHVNMENSLARYLDYNEALTGVTLSYQY